MKMQKMRSAACAGLGIMLSAAVLPVRADISQGVMFRNLELDQTGDGNTLAFDSAFFTLRLTASSASEYTTVQGFFGGPGSPVALTPTDSTTYEFDSGFFGNQATMDTAFPKGTYTLTATNPSTSDNATTMFDYTNDAYSDSQPYLAGTNYTDLQGMNPARSFDFQFSPFVKNSLATDPELFFTLLDATTGDVVFGDEFQPDTTTGVTLPANTLLPNHAYSYDLDFSDRLLVTSTGADFPALLGFETRTDGAFTTGAVPEPTAATLLAMGAGAGLLRRRRAAVRGR
jgi:hypothetical protein